MLYLGIGAEDFAANDPAWATRTINDSRLTSQTAKWFTIDLVSMTGPGKFSLWQNTDDGPLVWMDTANGITATDQFHLALGGHNHLNWAFTESGLYSIGLRATGYLDTNPNGFLDSGDTMIQSTTTNYNFGIEAVPEPATLVTMAGLCALVARRRRKA
jgi:surface-anchored protein